MKMKYYVFEKKVESGGAEFFVGGQFASDEDAEKAAALEDASSDEWVHVSVASIGLDKEAADEFVDFCNHGVYHTPEGTQHV